MTEICRDPQRHAWVPESGSGRCERCGTTRVLEHPSVDPNVGQWTFTYPSVDGAEPRTEIVTVQAWVSLPNQPRRPEFCRICNVELTADWAADDRSDFQFPDGIFGCHRTCVEPFGLEDLLDFEEEPEPWWKRLGHRIRFDRR